MSYGWSFGGSILTFVFPMLLFFGVAAALYILYTKPTSVPGHRTLTAEHPVSYTAIPGTSAATEIPGNGAPAPGDPATAAAVKAADGETVTPEVQE